MGKLTIVPTPVGNLGDITLRALETLREADLILAEDTRTSSILLKHYDIHKPLESHHKFNEFKTANKVAERIIAEELNVALISDAGTPAISDPGSMLVKACIANEIPVTCLPGATAFVPALVMSSIGSERFAFEGFLPVKKGRQTRLRELATEPRTLIIYESPYRVMRTLGDLIEHFGEQRPAATVREISKIHETALRGTLAELHRFYSEHEPKGEFVLIVAGAEPIKKNNKIEKNNNQE